VVGPVAALPELKPSDAQLRDNIGGREAQPDGRRACEHRPDELLLDIALGQEKHPGTANGTEWQYRLGPTIWIIITGDTSHGFSAGMSLTNLGAVSRSTSWC